MTNGFASYRVFGGILRSDISFPGLPRVDAEAPDWELRVCTSPPDLAESVEWGREAVESDVAVRLLASQEAVRLEYDDTGLFDICAGGRTIVWYPPREGIDLDPVRKDVLGRVFAVALHRAGRVTLHGSGVVMGQRAVGFMAPKLHGKSTTAAALVRAGGRLLSDDILPVDIEDGRAIVYPGVPTMNLRADSAMRVDVDTSAFQERSDRPKMSVTWSGDDLARTSVALDALYLLRPTDEAGAEVSRERIPGPMAPVVLLGQTKIGVLLGSSQAAELLDRMVALAACVPVFTLRVPRSLDRLDELVECLHGWHPGRRAATSQ